MKNTSNLLKTHAKDFEFFCDELLKWSKTHNITGYKTRIDIMQNISDSIEPMEFIGDFKTALDIGSGCGFPAIPLAICNNDKNFILVESNAKKASFLKIIALNLGLKNVAILRERVECVKSTPKVDLITSRAVDKAQNIIKISAHLLSNNGYFLLYKSANEFSDNIKNELRIYESKNAKIFYFYKSKNEALKIYE